MTYKTHTTMAMAISFSPAFLPDKLNFINPIPISLLPFVFFTIFLSSLFPDLDEPNSYLSKRFPWVAFSMIISSFTTHRGVTHRLAAVFIYTITFGLILALFDLYKEYWILTVFAFIGYLAHLIGDGFTIGGLRRFLYPLSKKTIWFLPKSLRFKTGSFTENIWFLFFSFLFFAEIAVYLNKSGMI